jgi:SPOR domain
MKSVQGLFVTLLLSSCALPSTDPRIDQAPMAADTKNEVRKFFWKPNPKAFAFSPEKGTYWAAWGSSSVEAAKRIAMEGCDGGTGTTCMLFAVNHQIVWEPTDEPPMTGAPEDEPPATSIAPGPVAAAPRAAELVRAIPHDGDLGVGVGGAVFNGDESRILSWGADNTVRLWDAATGREVVPAMRHDGGDRRQVAIHVASVRSPAEVPGEWQRLSGRYQVLSGLELQAPTTVKIQGHGTFYRVIGGAFATRAEAQAVCEGLRSAGVYCMIVVL